MKNNFSKRKGYLIVLGILIVIFLPIYIKARIKHSQIEENGNIGVGKFVEYVRHPKSRKYYFEYYKFNEKHKVFITNTPERFSKQTGNFYEIKYLDNYDDIIVNFDKEITDTVAILEAGFSREDIE